MLTGLLGVCFSSVFAVLGLRVLVGSVGLME